MKHTSKLAYLLGLPVLVGLSALSIINVVNGDVSIRVPSIGDLHRAQLHTLYLGKTSTSDVANVKLNEKDTQLIVSNGLIIGQNTDVGVDAFVFVGGGQNNSISGNYSGIGGGSNNKISSSSSVIGGGNGNSISGDDSQVNAIAGGNGNKAQAGGTVVGGMNNGINGTGVIIGGLNNKINGDGSLALGNNSEGGKGTFLWNGPRGHDYSAVIRAPGGVLIGTYDPITGVNLVVDGAVKIGTAETIGDGGEIRMMSGCFCAYNGYRWYAINKGLEEQCDCHGSGCTLIMDGKEVSYLPGDTVRMFKNPAGLVCHEVILNCRSDGNFGCLGSECSSDVTPNGSEYYSNCIVYGEPSCGSANGSGIVEAPTVDSELCRIGTLSGEVTSGNNTFTWTCKHNDESIGCSAKRLYECGKGNGDPRGMESVSVGSSTYEYGSIITGWTYKADGELGACEWTCQADAQPEDKNGNIVCKSDYECNDPAVGAMMFDNSNDYHVDNVNPASGPRQTKKLYSTREKASGHACSYVCAGGYEFLPAYGNKPDRCALCEDKTRVTGANGELIACQEKIDICKDKNNYAYDPETGKCIAYGHCLLDGYAKDKIPENSNIKSLTQVRPIGKDLNWQGYTYGTVVSGNSCKYVCDRGFIPYMTNGDVRCVQAYCTSSPSNTAGNSPYFTKNPDGVIRNPTSVGTHRKYIESNIEAYGGFQQQYSNQNGCYYSCPRSQLCELYRGCPAPNQNYWTCYSSDSERDKKCVAKSNCTRIYGRCLNASPSLVGYAKFSSSNYTANDLTFDTFTGVGGYHQRDCSEGCISPATHYYYTGINGKLVGVCWAECKDPNLYFDYGHNGGCKVCKSNLQKPDTGNIILGNPASCTGACGPGETPALTSKGAFDKCIPTVVDAQGCPEGSEYVGTTTTGGLICRSIYEEYLSPYGQCYTGLDLIINDNGVYKCGCSGQPKASVKEKNGEYFCACNDPNATIQVQDGNHYCVCNEGFTEDEEGNCQKQDEGPTDP